MPFEKLRLIEPLLRAVKSQGYTLPTAIQVQAIPHVLEGRDLMGCAQTGTGKTAAFALPIIQRLHGQHQHSHAPQATVSHPGQPPVHQPRPAGRVIRALILTPTRELAAQIAESFADYGRHTHLRHAVIFGGVKQGSQVQALRQGVDILVATPGRLLDLLNQQVLTLRHVEIFVLDEADRMLDMGFIHDIRRVIAVLPAKRQTLLFSATIPKEIRTLADKLLHNPVAVSIAAESPAADTVRQSLYHVESDCKIPLLEHLLKAPEITRALVFTRTKHGADKVAKRLVRSGIAAEAIHSNKSQNARIRALNNFKRGQTRVLIASDIAARGLDVEEISHVFNYDLPNVPETYVHRIGRTGRAGATGEAISFCSSDQRDLLRDIERMLGRRIAVLSHSVKPLPASELSPRPTHGHAAGHHGGAGQKRSHGQSAGHGQKTGHSQSAGHSQATTASGKPLTPEQQKTNFWNSRQKTHRRLTTGRGRRSR